MIFMRDFLRGSTAVPALCSVVCITAAFHFTFCSNTCSIACLLKIFPLRDFVRPQRVITHIGQKADLLPLHNLPVFRHNYRLLASWPHFYMLQACTSPSMCHEGQGCKSRSVSDLGQVA